MAAQLADELSMDDVLTIFRAEDDVNELDLPVHVLTLSGTRYLEDGSAPRVHNPEKAREREQRAGRWIIFYVEYPKINARKTLNL